MDFHACWFGTGRHDRQSANFQAFPRASTMRIQDFNERLKNLILIADGAMGSMLHESVGAQLCFYKLNSTEPEAVFRLHQAYIEPAAQIIQTNTLAANPFNLQPLSLPHQSH